LSFDELHRRLQVADAATRRRQLQEGTVEGVYVRTLDGQRLLNFGGNDYLGVVANHSSSSLPTNTIPRGASASSLVCGWSSHHTQLANALARLERTESAVVFPSGYAACSGTIATLCQADDLILSDELNHASLIDGCRMSKATRLIYPHVDLAYVAKMLKNHRSKYGNVWIVTDGIFSMDGDLAPLRELVSLAQDYDARLIVDEAHGTGVLGRTGGGLCEALGVQDQVSIRIGTLSKAVGHQGGFVAGPKVVVDYLIQFCRSLIYSTALSPTIAAGASEVIEAFSDWGDRRDRVARLSRSFVKQLNLPRLQDELESGVPIIPVILGSDKQAVGLSMELRGDGFFVPAIRPPTVPEGTARLRVSISAAHNEEQVESLAHAIGQRMPH
jgi:8-amino-7-oxononanoate synthase